MSRGKDGNKKIYMTAIETMGIDGRVIQLYREGLSINKIRDKLALEGLVVSSSKIQHFLKVRVKDPKKDEIAQKEKVIEELKKEVPPELKLLQAAEEAYRNYEACLNDDADKSVKKGKEREATDWFTKYSDLMEKQLKASGVYERAKQEAQKDQDKFIEVVWKEQVVCEHCLKVLEEKVVKHEVFNLADKQADDVKETIADTLGQPSISTDGKPAE